jgi:16S rRNA U516 pseudouridylate synthase RsuA-like enzyme
MDACAQALRRRTLLRRIDKGGVDAPLGVVHRLDRDTSGLMMFTRTASAKRVLTRHSPNTESAYSGNRCFDFSEKGFTVSFELIV